MFEADPYFHLLTLLALTPKIIYISQAGALSEMLTFSSKRSRDSVLYNMHGIFMRTSCRLVSLKRSQDMSPPLFLHCYCTRNLSWERSLWSDQEVHRFLPLKPSQSTHLHIIWIFLLFYINLIFFVFIIVIRDWNLYFLIQDSEHLHYFFCQKGFDIKSAFSGKWDF